MDIQKYMDKKNLGDRSLAEILGVNKTTIWRIRTGDGTPSPDLIRKIYALTGGKVTANDFFHRKAA